jgi:energy-coupling factor transporter ATP-binding protein EcfA2
MYLERRKSAYDTFGWPFPNFLTIPLEIFHRTRVWEIIEQLGLRDIADSRIGSGERRGISGGERRRLSIGLELIARPSVLILDEPTSGGTQLSFVCFLS